MTMTNAQKQAAYRERKATQARMLSQPGLLIDSNAHTPVLRYHGSKWRLSPWVLKHFPAHTSYIEPFGGAAGVLLRKMPSQAEIWNDLNSELYNFWRVVRNAAPALIRSLDTWDWSRESYERALTFAIGTKRYPPGLVDNVEQAAAFYVRNWLSFGSGVGRWRTGYRADSRPGTRRSFYNRDKLIRAQKRLQRVTLYNTDALALIQQHDGPGTLFYLDPPYVPSTRYKKADYSHEMTAADHEALLFQLKTLRGFVVVSGYPSELYQDMLAGWQCKQTTSSTKGTARIECLWLSPNIDLLTRYPLFEGGVT